MLFWPDGIKHGILTRSFKVSAARRIQGAAEPPHDFSIATPPLLSASACAQSDYEHIQLELHKSFSSLSEWPSSPASFRFGSPAWQCVPNLPTQETGPDLLTPVRTHSRRGQHGWLSQAGAPVGTRRMARRYGRMQGDHPPIIRIKCFVKSIATFVCGRKMVGRPRAGSFRKPAAWEDSMEELKPHFEAKSTEHGIALNKSFKIAAANFPMESFAGISAL